MTNRGTLIEDLVAEILHDDIAGAVDRIFRRAEALIARHVRVRAQETATTLSITSDVVALPTDFLGAVYFERSNPTDPKITIVAPAVIRRLSGTGSSGAPNIVAVEGTNLRVVPAGTVAAPTTIELLYFARFPALTADGDSNWLTTNAYDVVFDALAHFAARFIQDGERADRYLLGFMEGVRTLNEQENDARNSGGPIELYRELAWGE